MSFYHIELHCFCRNETIVDTFLFSLALSLLSALVGKIRRLARDLKQIEAVPETDEALIWCGKIQTKIQTHWSIGESVLSITLHAVNPAKRQPLCNQSTTLADSPS